MTFAQVQANAENTQIAKGLLETDAPLIGAALNGQGLNEEPLSLLCGPKPT